MIKPYMYQIKGARAIHKFGGRALLADEMGCLAGETIINVNRGGVGRKYTIEQAYLKFHGMHPRRNWNPSIPTYARAMCNGELRQHKVKNILFSGRKPVIKITLASGKTIRLTCDHLIAQTEKEWIEAGGLKPGDNVLTNGIPKCKSCGSTHKICTHPYAKFVGYCRKCIYRTKRNNNTKEGKWIDKDGYTRVSGQQNHPRAGRGGFVYEHILVMERHLGRYITWPEQVHHRNGNKSDNRLENLEVVSCSEHHRRHKRHLHMEGGSNRTGGLIQFIPKPDTVVSIEPDGEADVYDIVMEAPHRNFVANGIVVHNCGKTLQALLYLNRHPSIKPVVIICPAGLKTNWKYEARNCFGLNATILEGTRPNPIPKQEQVVIINYEILQFWLTELKRFCPMIVILDEAHYVSNRRAIRSKATKDLVKNSPKVVALTGTPLTNRPADLFSIVNILRPDLFPSFYPYGQRYCGAKLAPWGWEYKGATNLKELHNILEKNMMIRRKKEDVLTELPSKRHNYIHVMLSNRKEYNKVRDAFIEWITNVDPAKAKRAMRAEKLSQLGYLKRVCGELKLKSVMLWIDDYLQSSDGKLVVFAIHKAVIKALKERYKKNCVVVDGSTSMKDRSLAVKSFQEGKPRLFIGNIQAAGTGLTLTAASDLVFIELAWTSVAHSQAQDRIHRIGQKESVNIYYLIAEDTIEEQLLDLLRRKQKILDKVVDGRSYKQEESIQEQLIKKAFGKRMK